MIETRNSIRNNDAIAVGNLLKVGSLFTPRRRCSRDNYRSRVTDSRFDLVQHLDPACAHEFRSNESDE